jgi:hypothetical protein
VTPGGNAGEIQFNDGGAFNGVPNLEVLSENMLLVRQSTANRSVLDRCHVFNWQSFGSLAVSRYLRIPAPVRFDPVSGHRMDIWATTSVTSYGMSISISGASSSQIASTGGSPYSISSKTRYTTLASGTSTAGAYAVNRPATVGGTTYGGFRFRFIGASSATTDCVAFMGLMNSVPNASTTILSSGTTLILLGFSGTPGSVNYSLFYNDASGTPTQIDLGSNFPSGTASQAWLDMTLYSPPSGGVYYTITNRSNGAVAEGFLNSNIPASTDLLRPVFWTVNSTASAASFDFCRINGETY